MGSLLDAIGAVAIGGLFLITMFTTLFNVQVTGQNIGLQVTLNQCADVICDELDNYLGIVCIDATGSGTDTIMVAASDSFKFCSNWDVFADTTTSSENVIKIALGNSTPIGYPMQVTQNDTLIPGTDIALWLKSLNFTYYNEDDRIILTPIDSLDYIRSVKVEMEFFHEGSLVGPGERSINTKIIFWEYFKNLYI